MRIIAVWIALSPVLLTGGTIEFNRDIRPLLADKCFTCHGPDSGKKLPLRLDSEAGPKQIWAVDDTLSSTDIRSKANSFSESPLRSLPCGCPRSTQG